MTWLIAREMLELFLWGFVVFAGVIVTLFLVVLVLVMIDSKTWKREFYGRHGKS